MENSFKTEPAARGPFQMVNFHHSLMGIKGEQRMLFISNDW